MLNAVNKARKTYYKTVDSCMYTKLLSDLCVLIRSWSWPSKRYILLQNANNLKRITF